MFKLLNGLIPVINEICGMRTEIICPIGTDDLYGYHQQIAVGKIYLKGEIIMVDTEKIKMEIEKLKALTAEEYCADAVAKIYAEFEASREAKIKELEIALAIFAQYEIKADTDAEVTTDDEEKVEEVNE